MIRTLQAGANGTIAAWANQIPVASGLLGPHADKRRAVDLAHRCQSHRSQRCYVLIELKERSDTPLYAAFEILRYGLLYVFSRRRIKDLQYDATEQPLLRAERIHLRVLAPHEYYKCCKLDWLEKDLSQAIGCLACKKADVGMDFSFWQCELGLPECDWLKYWENGSPVYGGNATRW